MARLFLFCFDQWEPMELEIRSIIAPLHAATKKLLLTLDTDTETFNAYLTVQKMAESNPEEKRL